MCALIRQEMGDRYGKGSGGHAPIHKETHTARALRASPSPELLAEKNTPGYALLMFQYEL